MRKVIFKYFFDAIDGQQKWLNEMADQGYRLTGVTNYSFRFEACEPGTYHYDVELVTEKTYPALMRRRDILTEQGFHSFSKNMNINVSIGKAGSWNKGNGSDLSEPANHELLILESKKENYTSVKITESEDIISKYRDIRAVYLFLLLLACGYLIYRYNMVSTLGTSSVMLNVILAGISLFSIFVVSKYSKLIRKVKD